MLIKILTMGTMYYKIWCRKMTDKLFFDKKM